MHKRNSIVNVPLLIGSVLSVALHVAALYGKGIHTPPKPSMEQGRTVVRLTLLPSVASKASARSESPNPKQTQNEASPEIQKTPPPEPIAVPQAARLPDPVLPPEQPQASSLKPQASTPSPDQDASLIEEKGVTSEARTFKAASPVYPRISRRSGEEGTVTLSIEVLANGQVGNISIVQSSGYRRLDKAALKAAQKTRFTPAKQFGHNVTSTTDLSFTFRLTDD
ncbi:MAG: energy transducer TonB [Verrucomicrobia bacterium]|nr:energy transducer TonB [Verrucomicrobiota bacterium]